MSELAFCINPDREVALKLDAILAAGVSCVGANELDPVDYFNRDEPNTQVITSFARQVESRGMRVVTSHAVGGFVAGDGNSQQRAMDHLKREVDRAAIWSCPCLVFHYRQPAKPWSKSEMADWTAEIMRMGLTRFDSVYRAVVVELCDYAATVEVGIYFETMGPPFSFGLRAEQVLPLLDDVKRENLGVCLDSGHLHCSGCDVAAQIRATQGFPITVHLNDNTGPLPPTYDIYSSDLHLVPGLGRINWPQVILALRHVGYDGPFIFEDTHVPGARFEDSLAMTIANWRALERIADHMTEQSADG